jgi:hypothetical protein
MRSMRQRRWVAAVALVGVTACAGDAGRGDSARADSARRAAAAAGNSAARDTGRRTDAGTNGLWDAGSLEKRLDLQGMAPRRLPDAVHHAFLAVPGTAYKLGNAELQVFIYENAAAVARDVSRLDTVAVAPLSGPVQWPAKATLITNNNLAAILLSENGLQIERVQRALMAGTASTIYGPPPPSPR